MVWILGCRLNALLGEEKAANPMERAGGAAPQPSAAPKSLVNVSGPSARTAGASVALFPGLRVSLYSTAAVAGAPNAATAAAAMAAHAAQLSGSSDSKIAESKVAVAASSVNKASTSASSASAAAAGGLPAVCAPLKQGTSSPPVIRQWPVGS
jgi:hypothetical protein